MHVDEVAAEPTEQSACRLHYFRLFADLPLYWYLCKYLVPGRSTWNQHDQSLLEHWNGATRTNEDHTGWTSLDPLSGRLIKNDSEHHFCSLPQLSSRWVWPLKCLPHATDSPRMLRRWLSPTQTTANREHHTTRTSTDALLHDYFDSTSPSARTGQVQYGV